MEQLVAEFMLVVRGTVAPHRIATLRDAVKEWADAMPPQCGKVLSVEMDAGVRVVVLTQPMVEADSDRVAG